jgi:bifunctional non-homologous end joining protein LigD
MAKRALSLYRAKRDFSKTAEPSGQLAVSPSQRLRFVVQKHAARQLHYDLRLESDGVFKSWAVTRGPSLDPAERRLAVEVEDHPLDYGDFEGTIPAGEYGGGTVQLWDRGYWSPEGGKTPQEALESGDLKFTLRGDRLRGSWVLVRMRGDRYGNKHNNWLLIKHRDSCARPGDADALLAEDRSVASGRTLKQIAAGVGRKPKPFMLSGRLRADAVWTRGGSAAQPPGLKAKPPAVSTPRAAAKAEVIVKRPEAARTKPARVLRIPAFVPPQLCKLVDRPPSGPDWEHEVKLDGYRAQVRVQKHGATVRTRTGLDWTLRFGAIAEDAKGLPDCLLDGEVVALDQRRLPSFALLQAALAAERSEDLVFFAFDLLFEGREDLRTLPLTERKARLQKLLDGHDEKFRLRYTAHLIANAADIFASAQKMNLEGIVSKRLDAPYRSGRSASWTKAKVRAGQEVVIGGWTAEGRTVRSLLAGVYRGKDLIYVGRVGTGYGESVAKTLSPRLEKLTQESCPFGGDHAPPKEPNVRWVKPALVAEIEFAGWTATGMIRQAAFKGIREDKPPRDVVAEVPAVISSGGADPAREPAHMKKGKGSAAKGSSTSRGRRSAAEPRSAAPQRADESSKVGAAKPAGAVMVMGVSISKPDKALWPNAGDGVPVTKLDLARYYEQVGEWMLPHLAGRPCSLVRVPDGFGSEQFFQRHAMAGMSAFLSSVKVRGDKAPYVQIDRVEGLAASAQIGALEIHPWNCIPGNPELAGRLVFDLDPAPDVLFDRVAAAALEVRERLKAVGLESFCKTTGGKGLHVVTPLLGGKHAVEWPVAKNFAHVICAQMTAESPTRYLDTMSKNQRVGKIFLDYLRNDRTATAVAVLSPRAREGATVSMPIAWKQLRKGLDPKAFTVRSAPELLRKAKPWDGYDEAARSLSKAIALVTRGPKPKRTR